eukprot:731540-Amorphochlora_amoeboformis.AAC.2
MADPTAPTEPLDSADAVREFVHGIQAPKESEEKVSLSHRSKGRGDGGKWVHGSGFQLVCAIGVFQDFTAFECPLIWCWFEGRRGFEY